MDARMEINEEFSDFFNFSAGLTDNGHELQSDFSNTNFDLEHQEEVSWNIWNTFENQTFDNHAVGDQAFNNNALHEQGGLSLFPPPTRSKPRRQRLNRVQKACLSSWLVAHQSYPYPTAEEVSALAEQTLLTEKQIRTWFNNARSRQSFQDTDASDPTTARTPGRNIPVPQATPPTETPFQRWRNSPPEDEASVEAIKRTSLTMKYHNSLGYSDPDSGMVSESVFGRDSVASSFGSGSCSLPSRRSAGSSLSAASNNSRRKRKGRRRIFNGRSRVTQGEKIFVRIDCGHCQETSAVPINSTERINCPKCSRLLFQGGLFGATIRASAFCDTCDGLVEKVGLHQPKFLSEQHFTCRCGRILFSIIAGDLPASVPALTTPRHDDGEDGPGGSRLQLSELRFDCTFCPDTFKYKYTWERHETSIHCPQELWICMAKGPTIVMDIGTFCVFCNLPFPSHDHLVSHHNYAICLQRQISERTFERKDGLQQHLSGVHNHTNISTYMTENWSQHNAARSQHWKCGICNKSFNDWEVRLKHIGQHWDNGLDMTDWVYEEPLQEVWADVRAVPSSDTVEQHSVLGKRPESSRKAPVLDFYAMQHLEVLDRGGFQASSTSAAAARPPSRQAATFSWKGIFKRFQRA